MELILIRHGKAEDYNDEKSDSDRALTEKGRTNIKKAAYCLKKYINKNKNTLIWSSPKVRTAQTAQIICDNMGLSDIAFHDFIAGGNLNELSKEISKLEGIDHLIIVGHQPILGSWSQIICGHNLPFKKGAAAGIKLSDPSFFRGELMWFVQPKIFQTIYRQRKEQEK